MRRRTKQAGSERAVSGGLETVAQPGNLPRFMLDRPLSALLLSLTLSFLLLLLLRQVSHWDIALAEKFADRSVCPENLDWKCTPFPLIRNEITVLLRELGIILPYAAVFVFLVLLVWRVYTRARAGMLFVPLLALASAILGPVIITNVLLKGNWGRPRPEDTVRFGGEWEFVLPGTYSSQCADNCSFPSGEATFAFWGLMALALLPRRWHGWAALVVVAFASVIAALRVAFGKHYFSDVVMGGAVAVISILAVNWALQRWRWHERLAAWNATR